jgi:hypothetical protein
MIVGQLMHPAVPVKITQIPQLHPVMLSPPHEQNPPPEPGA